MAAVKSHLLVLKAFPFHDVAPVAGVTRCGQRSCHKVWTPPACAQKPVSTQLHAASRTWSDMESDPHATVTELHALAWPACSNKCCMRLELVKHAPLTSGRSSTRHSERLACSLLGPCQKLAAPRRTSPPAGQAEIMHAWREQWLLQRMRGGRMGLPDSGRAATGRDSAPEPVGWQAWRCCECLHCAAAPPLSCLHLTW